MSSVTTTSGRTGPTPLASRRARERPRPVAVWAFAGVLLLIPALLAVGKSTALPTSQFLTQHVSLNDLTPALRTKVTDILFVPVGALIVVVFRLTLGLRVLGPFRSVLLAFALLATGILVGVGFFAVTVGALLLLRPLIKALRLPYFGRISIMLSAVAVVIVMGALVGSWVGYQRLEEVAYLPAVVICLVAEAVARTVRTEGVRSGSWRAAVTVLTAIVVAGLASLAPLRSVFERAPEVVFVPIALIAIVSRFLAVRLFASFNPKVHNRPRRVGDDDPLGADANEEEAEA